MIKKYRLKMVTAGDYIEIFKYPSWRVQHCATFKKSFNTLCNKNNKRSNKFNQHLVKTRIIGLVNANHQELTKFITLTFRDNMQDLTYAHYEFKKFIQKIKRIYLKFKYIAVVEFQKRGAIHYHLICNLIYVNCKKIEQLWGNGFTEIRCIRHVRNVGVYFASHGIKNQTSYYEETKLYGRKKFFYSRKLKKPQTTFNERKINTFIRQNLNVLRTLYSNIYFDWRGESVEYTQFRLESGEKSYNFSCG